MAKVYINKEKDGTWGLRFAGDKVEPFNLQSIGHKTVSEARRWAKTWGHEIVTLTAKGVK